jgi:hypothetical protein
VGPAKELLSVQERALALPHNAISWYHISEWLHKSGARPWEAQAICKLHGQCHILLQCGNIRDQAWWVVYWILSTPCALAILSTVYPAAWQFVIYRICACISHTCVLATPRFLGQEFGNNNSYISRTIFYLCESCDCIRGTLVVASSIYGNLSVMSRSSDFWELIDNRWCRLLTVSTGGFTTYNTGIMGSVVYITAFSRRS